MFNLLFLSIKYKYINSNTKKGDVINKNLFASNAPLKLNSIMFTAKWVKPHPAHLNPVNVLNIQGIAMPSFLIKK